MQGRYQTNAGRGGRFHHPNGRGVNTRFMSNQKDWRLTQMLDEWETQQEARRREEALKEKAKERREFTKDLAKIINGKEKRRKRRESSSSESSISTEDIQLEESTPETSPEQSKKRKRSKKKRNKAGKHNRDESEVAKSLMDIRNTNEKICRDLQELKKAQVGTTATIERMEFEINSIISTKEKLEGRIQKLEKKPEEKKMIIIDNESKEREPESDDSRGELHDKRKMDDDKVFDMALKFGIASCTKKSELEKRFEKKEGTTKLKEFCAANDIEYVTKNKAIKEVWQLLLDNRIIR